MPREGMRSTVVFSRGSWWSFWLPVLGILRGPCSAVYAVWLYEVTPSSHRDQMGHRSQGQGRCRGGA